jgi:hypothetical protein
MKIRILIGLSLLVILTGVYLAQETTPVAEVDCSPEAIAQQQQFWVDVMQSSITNNSDTANSDMFNAGLALQQLALTCGYAPTQQQTDTSIHLTLRIASLPTIIEATSVGTDIEVIMEQLPTVFGDSFNGQLLYNGIENGLDGGSLGCLGCHNGENAPSVEGTWTRVNDERLLDPTLADYSVERYLVESILHPNDYIVEGYQPELMPDNFGRRMDLQQLADLVAFLNSQDQ